MECFSQWSIHSSTHPLPALTSHIHLKASYIVFDFVIFASSLWEGEVGGDGGGGEGWWSEAEEGTSDRSLTSRASLEVIEVREVEEAAGDNWNPSR